MNGERMKRRVHLLIALSIGFLIFTFVLDWWVHLGPAQ